MNWQQTYRGSKFSCWMVLSLSLSLSLSLCSYQYYPTWERKPFYYRIYSRFYCSRFFENKHSWNPRHESQSCLERSIEDGSNLWGSCYYYTPFTLVIAVSRGPTQRGWRLALTVMAHHEELAMSKEVSGHSLPVEILVFSSPPGYMLTCFGVFGLKLENISVNSFKSVVNFPEVLNLHWSFLKLHRFICN